MDINDVFGQPEVALKEETYKAPAISPFDFINAINFDKKGLIVDDWSEKQYIPYIVNRGLSFGADTVIQANEMNSRPHLDKKLQFDFLINIVRSRKRFTKWLKPEKIEAIKIVQEYYTYSYEKASQILPLLSSEQIDYLKIRIKKGGIND
jgi:hypothetical protein